MVGRIVLLVIFAGLLTAQSGDGDGESVWGVAKDGQVQVGGQKTTPGAGPTSERGDGRSSRQKVSPRDPVDVFVPPPTRGNCPDGLDPCGFANSPASSPAPAPVPSTPGTPTITLADIATFRPTPSPPASEPSGWGIAGLDTNFVADAGADVVTGTLLGRPASVRFTPTSYGWTYGDGARRTTASPGSTWQQSGVREFDPTPSSHVYAAPGDYATQLTVGYSAAYSWDGAAYVPITGTVTVSGGTVPVHIVVESTVLVGGRCAAGSTAPGC